MEFIVTREENQISFWETKARIEFIRDKQIPQLEKAGFTKALARQWYWLGYFYFRDDKYSEGMEATEKAKSLLTPADRYYALALNTLWVEEKLAGEFKDKNENRFCLGCDAYELRYDSSTPRFWKKEINGSGYLHSINRDILQIFRTASLCDGYFYNPELKVGKSMTGSDGTTLTFAAAGETVATPAGVFEGCELWVTKNYMEYKGNSTYKVYYKEGVGIVKYSCTNYGLTDTRLLAKYDIAGGEGLLPMHEGNEWRYADEYNPEYIRSELTCRVTHADGKSAIIATTDVTERFGYDENSWLDMIQQIRNEYCKEKGNRHIICDISHAVERAEVLAKTPIEKAHTKTAASVVRRIMATDGTFSPERTADGLWNFFQAYVIHKNGGNVKITYDSRWSFEWKGYVEGGDVIACNHIYGILQDAGKYLWSDEWKIGADTIVEYTHFNNPLKINISCTDGGTVTTKGGTFENCLKISFDIQGMGSAYGYRGGNKEYYFAEGVGIVRVVNEFENLKKATYELISYTGTGEGYMPVADGLVRKYEAVDLTDGFYASSEYTYVADENGDIYIFADKCGIRNKLPAITLYSTIQDEVIEKELWDAGKREESRLRHDVNNFKLLLHFLGRDAKVWAAPKKATAWSKEIIKIIEDLSVDGEIPRAWRGCYYRQHFNVACRLFGCGEKEEGYEYLEKAFELYPKWANIPDGELLEVGDELIYGGIKLVKGKSIIELPDGTREGIDYGFMLNPTAENMYYGMTAKRGWEWFNSVREEERFKWYIERAKALMESENKK